MGRRFASLVLRHLEERVPLARPTERLTLLGDVDLHSGTRETGNSVKVFTLTPPLAMAMRQLHG